ncbi:hypothetical protein VNO80_25901 [Phaseolus coccineus]|uniref:Uncharacterized protein n=1 Tax=Phaseolus coccineus TaxID=3886 RepID=A0AAN9LZG3_PHACN
MNPASLEWEPRPLMHALCAGSGRAEALEMRQEVWSVERGCQKEQWNGVAGLHEIRTEVRKVNSGMGCAGVRNKKRDAKTKTVKWAVRVKRGGDKRGVEDDIHEMFNDH